MKRQPYPVAQLTGGLDISADAVFLVDKASPHLRNVRFDKGLIKKGLGYVAFGAGFTAFDTGLVLLEIWVMTTKKLRVQLLQR